MGPFPLPAPEVRRNCFSEKRLYNEKGGDKLSLRTEKGPALRILNAHAPLPRAVNEPRPSAILLLQEEVSEWHFAVDTCIVV